MTKTLIHIFIFFTLNFIGQNNTVELSGKVFSHPAPFHDKNDTIFIEEAEVVLRFKDSISLTQYTDQNGHYSFKLNTSKRPAKIFIILNKKSGNKYKYMCGFLATKEIFTLESVNNSNSSINFYVPPANCCINFPFFIYEKNKIYPSSAFFIGTPINVDSAINYTYRTIRDKFYLTLCVKGHADTLEINPTKLSLERAEYLIKTLSSMGINQKRLSSKAYGNTQPMTNNTFGEYGGCKKIFYKPRELNRLVTISILEFDFGVKRPADNAND
ncbi:MAG: OmpA family protein [Bacteroidota bacterium]|nr:OmpA family protein [Bacteroidota bacterium]MDP3146464.1 OmpA family protein [Bacteroidota bacterium]